VTPSEVLELVGRIQVTWPRTKWAAPVEFVGTVWLDYLADLPADAVRATLVDLPPTWAPAPGELREAVLARIDPDVSPDGDEAWAEVQAGIRRWGASAPYHRPFGEGDPKVWSHPAVAAAVEAFGWGALCRADNPGTDRAQFRDFYAAARARHRPRRTPPAAAVAIDAARARWASTHALPAAPAVAALGAPSAVTRPGMMPDVDAGPLPDVEALAGRLGRDA